MAFLNETGLATFLSYLKAWARSVFASKTDTQTIEGSTTFSQPIIGNLTGNCSGSSGSCTGNAATATTAGTCTGNAGTATKLKTARVISAGDLEFQGSANFDGSGNIVLNVTNHRSIVSVGNANNYPFHRIAYVPVVTGSYIDDGITFLVSKDYVGGGYGIARITFRTNNVAIQAAQCSVQWLCRTSDIAVNAIQVGFVKTAGASYLDVFYHSDGTYKSAVCRVLAHSYGRNSVGRSFTVVSASTEVHDTTATDPKTSVESYKTISDAGTALHSQAYTDIIAASDVGVVGNAATASAVAWSGVTGKPTTIAGYGITDAKIANGTITLGSNSITPLISHQDISGKVNKSGDRMTGDLKISTGTQNQLRLLQGNYGVIFRNDGSNFYLLQTASGQAEDGSWTNARPLIVNLSTGVCDINGNAATSTDASRLKSSTPDATAHKVVFTGGQPVIGTSAGNAYVGSSNNVQLISVPENGTEITQTIANAQNLRFIWNGSYFSDIFASPNNRYVWHRDVANKVAYPWRRLVEENAAGITAPDWNISIAGNATTATSAQGLNFTNLGENYQMNNASFTGAACKFFSVGTFKSGTTSVPYSGDAGDYSLLRLYGGADTYAQFLMASPRDRFLWYGRFWNGAFDRWVRVFSDNDHIRLVEGNTVLRAVDNDALYLAGGTDIAVSAHLKLCGKDYTGGTGGAFNLIALTSFSNAKILYGDPSGTLQWNGQNIQTTSDQRLKTKLESIPDEVLDAWEGVEWGQFQYLEAVEEKGKSARLHAGLVSQQVQMAFSDRGLDACDYGLICHETKAEVDEDVVVKSRDAYTDAEGAFHPEEKVTEHRHEDAVDLWMIRYAEALCMEAAYQRRRADRLEARIAALEEAMNG